METVVARFEGLLNNPSSRALLSLGDGFGLFVSTPTKRLFMAGVIFLFTWVNTGIAQTDEEIDRGDTSSEAEEVDSQAEAEEAQRALDQFLRREIVLIRQGEIELEFSAFYSVEEVNNLRLRELDRFGNQFQDEVTPKFTSRSVDTSLLIRYGIMDDFEFNFTIPVIYIHQEADFAPFELQEGAGSPFVEDSNAGLGDISGELRYTVSHEDGTWPTTTLSLNGKSRTGDENESLGSGHWNTGAGFTLVKTIDPVVLFGSLGYTYTHERNRRDPGDQISYSFGMGFSLNDRVSYAMSLVGTAIRKDEEDGETIRGSNRDLVGLQVGLTVQLARRFFAEPQVGFGLTEDATDFIGGVNLSYRFENTFP